MPFLYDIVYQQHIKIVIQIHAFYTGRFFWGDIFQVILYFKFADYYDEKCFERGRGGRHQQLGYLLGIGGGFLSFNSTFF